MNNSYFFAEFDYFYTIISIKIISIKNNINIKI